MYPTTKSTTAATTRTMRRSKIPEEEIIKATTHAILFTSKTRTTRMASTLWQRSYFYD